MKTAKNSCSQIAKRPVHPKVIRALARFSSPISPPVATRDEFQPIHGKINQFKITHILKDSNVNIQ